jgi:hypothetical protein
MALTNTNPNVVANTPINVNSPLTNPTSDSKALSDAVTPSGSTPDFASSLLGLGGIGYTAYNANKQAGQQAQTLNDIRKPLTEAGGTYLSNALSGALTPSQSKQYNDLVAQSNTLTNQANPLIAQGTQGIAQATAGQLPSWQQTQLDNATAAALAQARASMGANVDSSSMAQVEAQIRQQAVIAQGQMAQQNLQTYEQLYMLGATTQKEAMALLDAANQSVITNLQQDFSNAIQAFAGGNAAAMDRINTQLANDSILSQSLDKIIKGLTTSNGKNALEVAGGKVGDAIKRLFGYGDTSGGYTAADKAAGQAEVAYFGGTSTGPNDFLTGDYTTSPGYTAADAAAGQAEVDLFGGTSTGPNDFLTGDYSEGP